MVNRLAEPQQAAEEEATLIRQVLAGSPEAFAVLIRLHHAAVRFCISRYVHDAAAADDVAQEVFFQAYRGLAKYEGTGGIRTWFLGIARNLCRQYLRGEIRRWRREGRPLQMVMAQWQTDALSRKANEVEDHEQILAALRECLETLAPESRDVVREHYVERTVAGIDRAAARAEGWHRADDAAQDSLGVGECIRRKMDGA